MFSDETEVATSIPAGAGRRQFNPDVKMSEIATMAFVRESGLYPDIPVPQVYGYDTTFANGANTPYTIMEVMKGRRLADIHEVQDCQHLSGLDAMCIEDQMAVAKSLGRLQASLSQPVPFERVGCVNFAEGGFDVGPLFVGRDTFGQGPYHVGPFKSLYDIWISFLDNEF